MNGIIWSFRYATRRPPAPGADRWSLAEPCRDLLRSVAHRFRQLHAPRPCTGRAQVAPNGDSKDSMKSWFHDPRFLPALFLVETQFHLFNPAVTSECDAAQIDRCAGSKLLHKLAVLNLRCINARVRRHYKIRPPTLFLVESAPVRLLQPRIITEKQLYLRDPLRILLTV